MDEESVNGIQQLENDNIEPENLAVGISSETGPNDITANHSSEMKDSEEPEIADSNENLSADSKLQDNSVSDTNKTSNKNLHRLTHLPIARVKHIMKFDDDVHYATQEAIFLVTKATEFFINSFMKEVYQNTIASKKKTVSKRDVDAALFSQDCFLFLDGALD